MQILDVSGPRRLIGDSFYRQREPLSIPLPFLGGEMHLHILAMNKLTDRCCHTVTKVEQRKLKVKMHYQNARGTYVTQSRESD